MKGKITIVKTTVDTILIRIYDSSSELYFLEVELDILDFTKALFGSYGQPCIFEITNSEEVKKESKNAPSNRPNKKQK
jgi:hypothetical protein